MKIDPLLAVFKYLILLLICHVARSQDTVESDTTHSYQQIPPENVVSFVDTFFNAYSDSFHVPGLVVSIVQGNQLILSKGCGYANLEEKIPMSPQTVVRVGSVSKPITATAIIQFIERGLVDLDEPIDTYLTEMNLDDSFGTASTAAQLLNHMAGYPDQILRSHAPTFEEWDPLESVLQSDLPDRVIHPGKVMAYSSWDYALLGYILQKVSGDPYEQVIEFNLLNPLGMHSSTFQQPLPEPIFEKLAIGYGYNEAKEIYEVVPHDFVRMSPGVALVSSGEDMAKYMMALLNGGSLSQTRILKEESLSMLFERQVSAHPYSRGRSLAFPELTLAGRKVFYHDGNGIGFSNRLVLMPEHQLGIFMSTNHRSLSRELRSSMASNFLKNLSTQILENFVPASVIQTPVVELLSNNSKQLKRFVGHYRVAQLSRNDFFKMEALTNHVDVKEANDGSLLVGSGRYQQVESLLFQNIRVPSFFVVFVENDSKEIEFLSFGGTGTYQKTKGYQNAKLHMGLFGISGLLFISMILLWPFKKHGHWLVIIIGLINLAFLTGLGFLLSGGIDLLVFFKSLPEGVKILFYLPWISLVLTLLLIWTIAFKLKNSECATWKKIHYTLFSLSSLILFWLAHFWNLLS